MTATVTPQTTGGATLGSVVDALADGIVRLVVAPRGLDLPVHELVVHDPLAEPAPGPEDLLLAVGVDPARASAIDVVTACGSRGAAAVLLKEDGDLAPGLIAAAEASGVALLVAPRGAAWGRLHAVLRSARSVGPPHSWGAPAAALGGLFGVADALTSAVGGAIGIEDERSAVLAYSTDGASQAAVLGRRAPDEWLERRRSCEQLRAVLEGRLPAALLAETLQAPADAPVLLMGSQAVARFDDEPGLLADRVADFLVFSCAAAFRRRVVATGMGPTAYALLPARTAGADEARVVAAELAGRMETRLRAPLRVVVADAGEGLGALLDLRADLDRALHAQAGWDLQSVAYVDDLRAARVLVRLRGLAERDLSDPEQRLVAQPHLHLLRR